MKNETKYVNLIALNKAKVERREIIIPWAFLSDFPCVFIEQTDKFCYSCRFTKTLTVHNDLRIDKIPIY